MYIYTHMHTPTHTYAYIYLVTVEESHLDLQRVTIRASVAL